MANVKITIGVTMEEKHFEEWMELKEELHFGESGPKINDGDIWWCALGENVGVEINGKSSRFSRPVLIMKRLSGLGFMGIPLTSQRKTGSWYTEFKFLDKKQFAALCQARVLSVSRLYAKIGQISESDLILIRKAFCELYKE